MDIDRRTPVNTAIVLINYVTGFANLFRSQTVAENVSGAVALAKTAGGYGVPLVVSVGPDHDPRGPLYPEVAAVIADHPVIHRGGSFDAFDHGLLLPPGRPGITGIFGIFGVDPTASGIRPDSAERLVDQEISECRSSVVDEL